MRIESPRYTERCGSVRINDVQKVLELDSGKFKEREYDETLKLEGSRQTINRLLTAIKKEGLNYAHGGAYYDVWMKDRYRLVA